MQSHQKSDKEQVNEIEENSSLFDESFVGRKYKQLDGCINSIGKIFEVIEDLKYQVRLKRENGIPYRVEKRTLLKHYEEVK